MAKNDFHVIAYRILQYLYECMKAGQDPEVDRIAAKSFSLGQIWSVLKRIFIAFFNIFIELYLKNMLILSHFIDILRFFYYNVIEI